MSRRMVDPKTGGGGIGDAPFDGKLYARRNGAWIEITGDIQPGTFTVTFVDWDNTVLKTETVQENGAATPPANPTREGYVFSGWNKSFNNVTSNLTIKALYTIEGGIVDPTKGLTFTQLVNMIYGAANKTNLVSAALADAGNVDLTALAEDDDWSNTIGFSLFPNALTNGIIIPEAATVLGGDKFSLKADNNYNQPLVINPAIETIKNNTFRGWASATEQLFIPYGIKTLGSSVFNGWTNNDKPVIISESVESMGGSLFYNWASASRFEVYALTPPSITNSTFKDTNNALIYVPDASVNDYKAATNWIDLSDRIFPLSQRP